jgi:hypothetical protein
LDLCKNVFGDGVFPDIDATNLYYGGTKIAGLVTNLCLSCMNINDTYKNLSTLCLHASLALPFYKCVISFCVIIRAI